MIESNGTAPYAPTDAVLDVVHAYRDRPVPTPIDATVVEKIGVAATIVPRTIQALKLLDLIDAQGNPTEALQGLRTAGSDEYHARLAAVVRAAYADVFMYRDPATDDVERIEDAFRSYEPVSMRPRMVRLFLGLCKEAGIIEETRRVTSPTRPTRPAQRQARSQASSSQPATTTVQTVSASPGSWSGETPGAEHLAIRGLLMTLPPVGAVFPEHKRREWADAVLATFALIYRRDDPETSEGGGAH